MLGVDLLSSIGPAAEMTSYSSVTCLSSKMSQLLSQELLCPCLSHLVVYAPYCSLFRLRFGTPYSLNNNSLLICHCCHEFKHLEITCICCSKCNYGDRNRLVQRVQSVIKLKLSTLAEPVNQIKSALFLWLA